MTVWITLSGSFLVFIGLSVVQSATLCEDEPTIGCTELLTVKPNMCQEDCLAELCKQTCGKCPTTPAPVLECYECSEMNHPNDCNHTVQCPGQKSCIITQTFTASLEEKFQSGCVDNDVCQKLYHSVPKPGSLFPRSITYHGGCCATSLCNRVDPDIASAVKRRAHDGVSGSDGGSGGSGSDGGSGDSGSDGGSGGSGSDGGSGGSGSDGGSGGSGSDGGSGGSGSDGGSGGSGSDGGSGGSGSDGGSGGSGSDGRSGGSGSDGGSGSSGSDGGSGSSGAGQYQATTHHHTHHTHHTTHQHHTQHPPSTHTHHTRHNHHHTTSLPLLASTQSPTNPPTMIQRQGVNNTTSSSGCADVDRDYCRRQTRSATCYIHCFANLCPESCNKCIPCFNCEYTRSPSDCKQSHTCQWDEICITVEAVSPQFTYGWKTACATEDKCKALNLTIDDPNHGSGHTGHSSHLDGYCCSTPHCNNQTVGGHTAAHQPSTTISPLVSSINININPYARSCNFSSFVGDCPQGFVKLGLSCYYFGNMSQKMNWTSARDFCRNRCTRLVIIGNHEEARSLSSRILHMTTANDTNSSHAYWTDARKVLHNGKPDHNNWISDSTRTKVTYHHFTNGHPDHVNPDGELCMDFGPKDGFDHHAGAYHVDDRSCGQDYQRPLCEYSYSRHL